MVSLPSGEIAVPNRKPTKPAYLKKHLHYELLMLRYTNAQINKVLPPLAWNAHFESFGLHARIFYHFLTNEADQNAFKAQDFVEKTYSKLDKGDMPHIVVRLNSQVVHFGKGRERQVQLDTVAANKLFVWIEEALSAFEAALLAEYQRSWKPETADPAKISDAMSPAPVGFGPIATRTTIPDVRSVFTSFPRRDD